MDVDAHIHWCTHTKQHKPLSTNPLRSTPGCCSLSLLVSYLAVHLGKHSGPRCTCNHGAACAGTEKHWAHVTRLLSDTAPAHPQQVLFSLPKEGCGITRAPAILPRGILRWLEAQTFPFWSSSPLPTLEAALGG